MVPPLHTEFGNLHSKLSVFVLHFLCVNVLRCGLTNVTYKPDQYRVETFPRFARLYRQHLPADRIVRFRSADGTKLPDPGLMVFHLAIAHALHTTGMAEEIDRYIEESTEEDLTEDTSAEMSIHNWLMTTA